MKKAVSEALVLGLPNFFLPFQIECDALGKAIGAILLQQGHHVAFLSQALKGKALSLSTYENELLALVSVVQKWRPHLLGTQFTVKTDHQSLKFLLYQKIGTSMLQN